jgi:dihydrofolate reductase
MRKIITTTMLTLDGVMQAPGGPEEDTSGGFKYGGWEMYWDEESGSIIDARIQAEPFDLLLGKRTYTIWASYWPKHKDEERWGKPFDHAKKYVVSHKPFKLTWDKSESITGDIVEEIKKLKKSDGPNLLIYGSGNLIQSLLKNNLIDRMHIWIFPVTIGSGKKLFAEGTQPECFKVIYAKATSSGILFATYEPVEPLKIGS